MNQHQTIEIDDQTGELVESIGFGWIERFKTPPLFPPLPTPASTFVVPFLLPISAITSPPPVSFQFSVCAPHPPSLPSPSMRSHTPSLLSPSVRFSHTPSLSSPMFLEPNRSLNQKSYQFTIHGSLVGSAVKLVMS